MGEGPWLLGVIVCGAVIFWLFTIYVAFYPAVAVAVAGAGSVRVLSVRFGWTSPFSRPGPPRPPIRAGIRRNGRGMTIGPRLPPSWSAPVTPPSRQGGLRRWQQQLAPNGAGKVQKGLFSQQILGEFLSKNPQTRCLGWRDESRRGDADRGGDDHKNSIDPDCCVRPSPPSGPFRARVCWAGIPTAATAARG
jgi:hypothetical protein